MVPKIDHTKILHRSREEEMKSIGQTAYCFDTILSPHGEER